MSAMLETVRVCSKCSADLPGNAKVKCQTNETPGSRRMNRMSQVVSIRACPERRWLRDPTRHFPRPGITISQVDRRTIISGNQVRHVRFPPWCSGREDPTNDEHSPHRTVVLLQQPPPNPLTHSLQTAQDSIPCFPPSAICRLRPRRRPANDSGSGFGGGPRVFPARRTFSAHLQMAILRDRVDFA
jgi:hypothetical protein